MTAAILDVAASGETTYDLVPYTSHPFPQTHPDRLATVATLLGLSPPPIERCRVLELGCASGGNLAPMAVSLPESHFVGVDLSARQIEEGQRVVATLGLTNIELRQLNLLDFGPDFGTFDYIICHGVYSWVPDVVREQILRICARNLSPTGVAYISYNTYPGWHMRGMIRDMMYYHAQRFDSPGKKVAQARALLDFLAETNSGKEGPYALLLQQELGILRDKPDDYLLHEHLEEINAPIYFHQFIQAATGHGLRYLGEAVVGTMAANTFPPPVQEALQRVAADQVQREQYMDFLRNRTFRQTLLCHADQPVSYKVDATRLQNLHVASSARPTSPPALNKERPDRFTGPGNASLTTSSPLMKAALLVLAASYPGSLPFPVLLTRAEDWARRGGAEFPDSWLPDPGPLGGRLLNAYLGGVIELFCSPPRFVVEPTERPVACPLARWQAAAGDVVTNRRHQAVRLNDAERHVLRRLDGSRDRAALAEELVALCRDGTLTARHAGEPVRDPEALPSTIRNALPGLLTRLARHALLMG